jgi:hypothetical protein
MEDFFKGLGLKEPLSLKETQLDMLMEILKDHISKSPLSKRLGPFRLDMLKLVIEFRLREFFELLLTKTSGSEIVIEGVEYVIGDLKKNFSSVPIELTLKGKLDLVLKINGDILILDFKTGSYKDRGNLIKIERLIELLKSETLPNLKEQEIFETLRAAVKDIQVLFYLYLYWFETGVYPKNGCYVYLSAPKAKMEVNLFQEKLDDKERKQIIGKTEDLIAMLVKHMLTSEVFQRYKESAICGSCMICP